jgi:hypothetical protein
LLLKPGRYRLKKLSCTFFVSGHAKKMCMKSSSGTGIFSLIEQKVQPRPIFWLKCDTRVFRPRMLFLNLKQKSRSFTGYEFVFHCEFRITTQSAAGTGKSINLKKSHSPSIFPDVQICIFEFT